MRRPPLLVKPLLRKLPRPRRRLLRKHLFHGYARSPPSSTRSRAQGACRQTGGRRDRRSARRTSPRSARTGCRRTRADAASCRRAASPRPSAPEVPIPRLQPVPHGQDSIVRRPPPPTTSASASPGPSTGMPGRPGVAPRPGQALPGQGGKGPVAPAPRGNGPLNAARTAPARGQRPLPSARPRGAPVGPRPGVPANPDDAPAPSAGGRPGDRSVATKTRRPRKKTAKKNCCSKKSGSARRRVA